MQNEAFQHLLRVFCVLAVGVATVGCGKTGLAGSNVAVAAREETKRDPPQRTEIVRAFTDVTEQAGVAHLHHKPVFEAKVKNIEPWLASVGAAAAASDYDNDGDVDLYVTNSRKGFPNALYRNNGDGTFTDVAKEAGIANVNDKDGLSMDTVWGDYDNDGDDDLYIVKWGRNLLFRNEGNGKFTDVSARALGEDTRKGMNSEFGDFNNDGWLDLYVSNIMTREYLKEGNILFRNNGDGTFADIAPEAGVADGGWAWAAKFFDYDNDGDLDVYLVNQNQKAALFRNDLGNKNHWIAFQLIGKGNAIGARVTVTAGDLTQIREVDGGNGFSSQSDRRLYFGLGRRDKVDRVEIRWANGKVQTLRDVKVGMVHTLKEP